MMLISWADNEKYTIRNVNAPQFFLQSWINEFSENKTVVFTLE